MKKLDAETYLSRLKMLVIVGIIVMIGGRIGYGIPITQAVVGMIFCIIIGLAGFALRDLLPLKIPAIGYIMLIALILTMPYLATADFLLKYLGQSKINFLGTCTPVLAYAGISIGLTIIKLAKAGWKLILVAFVVFLGTFLGSAIIAQVVLKLLGEI